MGPALVESVCSAEREFVLGVPVMDIKSLEHASPAVSLALSDQEPFLNEDNGHALAQAIVDTIREPLMVLDKDLRVVTANRSFYLTFTMNRQDVQGRPLYALGNGQWNIPELRLLLENIAPRHAVMEAYEVEQEFPGIGRRTMLLNARKVFYEDNAHTTILLGIEDITERRAREVELRDLLEQKEVLLQEMQHRVANSLQIIASILLIKARTVRSEETRLHLEDAHQRVMSVAAVQQQLHVSEPSAMIELGPYLTRLCETLAASMIGDRRPISLQVHVQDGTASSSQAVSLGLIVTELVINAIKHAFPGDRAGSVNVTYDVARPNWRLSVSDDGIGKPTSHSDKPNPGLGTTIIEALARQLDALVNVAMDSQGTTVSITHASFAAFRLPAAA
ncbi:MAG TPA: histidine kinase dimerization/phosphoacceptor domain -containing protein [Candidatus Acidoferrales bacterium]|nr:histidine kinase dimerization/phosphoacceptor domain -containing protein [Candidatus Acidoferrales bacterium]